MRKKFLAAILAGAMLLSSSAAFAADYDLADYHATYEGAGTHNFFGGATDQPKKYTYSADMSHDVIVEFKLKSGIYTNTSPYVEGAYYSAMTQNATAENSDYRHIRFRITTSTKTNKVYISPRNAANSDFNWADNVAINPDEEYTVRFITDLAQGIYTVEATNSENEKITCTAPLLMTTGGKIKGDIWGTFSFFGNGMTDPDGPTVWDFKVYQKKLIIDEPVVSGSKVTLPYIHNYTGDSVNFSFMALGYDSGNILTDAYVEQMSISNGGKIKNKEVTLTNAEKAKAVLMKSFANPGIIMFK